MAQRKQLTWTELRVGLFVLAGLFILAIAIFYVTGAGFLGPKYRVITYLPEVEGLQVGAPVRLDGVEIGNVQSIQLTPQPEDHMHNITLVLRIEKKFQPDIRTDSSASLITEGLLGNRYVTVRRGLHGTSIPNGGILPGGQEPQMTELVQKFSALSNQIGDILTKVNNGQGTLAKLLNDPGLYDHVNDTIGKVDEIAAGIQRGEGTAGKLLKSDELYNRVNASVGDAQNVIAAVRGGQGTIGKLVYDPSMYDNAKKLMDNGNGLVADIRAGKGTLGKLTTDDALYTNLKDASANFREASAKMNTNEGTIGKFFGDPAFYDNFSGLAGDMRLMISDFRQNPKKFLHVKLAIF
ncbi:MAG TPA: MlaD family protein [Candidatus Acidoferrum sp.]|nr:MlaD family protein [Candidatus Acidoferrum sp.]